LADAWQHAACMVMDLASKLLALSDDVERSVCSKHIKGDTIEYYLVSCTNIYTVIYSRLYIYQNH